jgi:hypothetical protein
LAFWGVVGQSKWQGHEQSGYLFGHKNNKVVAFLGVKMNASLFIANLKLIHLKVGKSNCENGIHSNNPYA